MAELIPIPFPNLLKRIYYEYTRTSSLFDLPSRKFYSPSSDVDLSVLFCGNPAANPVGPAAGPQTQLAQNIVLSWLAGSRILELKTVQIKDRLQLTRPCIDMATVGYNTEWSQELRLEESLKEYVKASMIVEILKQWLRVRDSGFDGRQEQLKPLRKESFGQTSPKGVLRTNLETIFDVSVGYDLAGIRSKEICQWLQTMRNASALVDEYRKEIPSEFASYRDLPFKTEIANSITLSTFHETPADEIERICEFLLTEMDYHVIIKMNPPMLGKERIEYLLHEKLGYTDVEVNENIYKVNINFPDAVDVVRRLQRIATMRRKTIGVKFGNTLEVVNKGNFLKDKIQYLSGQPLHVLHLALVDEWRKVFGAVFPVSFAAGVDANNFADCVAIGLVPITTCTDLLRPGGYGRLPQYLNNLERRMKEVDATTIQEFIMKMARRQDNFEYQISNDELNADQSAIRNPQSTFLDAAILFNTSYLLEKSIENPRYHYSGNKKPPRKIGSHLHLWDCINCDKCIPVCPNDANFYFEIEPFEIQFKNIEIVNNLWREIDGGVCKIEESHQIANFADACNDCGNCDVFCPEDGGPYIEKPRFFGSLDSWQRWKQLSGFVLTQENGRIKLHGRFKDQVCTLTTDNGGLIFENDMVMLRLNTTTYEILHVQPKGQIDRQVVDFRYFLIMNTLLKGMLNLDRIHFVNIDVAQ